MQEAQVLSLVGELRSHMQYRVAKYFFLINEQKNLIFNKQSCLIYLIF